LDLLSVGIIGGELCVVSAGNVAGTLRFNSEKDILQICDGTRWIKSDNWDEVINWLEEWKEEDERNAHISKS
jgi:hypothetical protein